MLKRSFSGHSIITPSLGFQCSEKQVRTSKKITSSPENAAVSKIWLHSGSVSCKRSWTISGSKINKIQLYVSSRGGLEVERLLHKLHDSVSVINPRLGHA